MMYYIRNKCVIGNSALWWREGGSGYTCDLKHAWMVDLETAMKICADRPEQDMMIEASFAQSLIEYHIDVQGLPNYPVRGGR